MDPARREHVQKNNQANNTNTSTEHFSIEDDDSDVIESTILCQSL